MALKSKYGSLKEIPAEDVRLYVERDGAWHLDVDAKEDKAKLEEFRANNIALKNQLAEQMKRFEGIDPEQVRKLLADKGATDIDVAHPRMTLEELFLRVTSEK